MKRHAVLTLAFGVALSVTAVFLVRLTLSMLLWSDAGLPNRPIEGWMTPRFVAKHWDVTREVVIDALGPMPQGGERAVSLATMAERQGRDLDEMITGLKAAIRDARAQADTGIKPEAGILPND
ncbi:MAG: hypothetical protein ACKVKF_15920 [Rhodobacterales bacterium]|nr:hypothetical protein [Puniceibacterium antarcticum]